MPLLPPRAKGPMQASPRHARDERPDDGELLSSLRLALLLPLHPAFDELRVAPFFVVVVVLAVGVIVGLLFLALGCGRLYLLSARRQ